MEEIDQKLRKFTYSSYHEAVGIEADAEVLQDLHKGSPYNVYSWANVKHLLYALFCLLIIVAAPYMMLTSAVMIFALSRVTIFNDYHGYCLVAALLTFVVNAFIVFREHFSLILSPGSELAGRGSFGANLQAGLHVISTPFMSEVLKKCPVITSKEVLRGDLTIQTKQGREIYRATPWVFCGNVRTLIPFCTFNPKKVSYERRWIRVPLSDRNHRSDGPKWEAVALDWLAPQAPTKDGKVRALLMLAGLTGGSEEGYILDMVGKATQQGYHCFVLVARGLAGTPLHSNVFFSGARVHDILEAAKAVRIGLGKDAKICAAGISMGGIIIANASVRTEISKYVDCTISIAGCLDTRKNVHFPLTRSLWQPILAHGLKEAFVTRNRYWKVVEKIFGDKLPSILDRIRDVYDFDAIMVTHLHNFDSVNDYYSAMCANEEQLSSPQNPGLEKGTGKALRLKKPMLVVNTRDDPIIHIDSLPTVKGDPVQPLLVENQVVLITDTGGHVGWPVGLFPWQHGFKLMAHLVLEFSEAVFQTMDEERNK